MAEFRIDGRMKVKTLKENFFNEYGGILHIKDGNKLADNNATLAAIRQNDDAKGGTLTCRASRTVGKFEQELWDVFGIKVNVFTGDDWVAVLDGITLGKIKDIPKQATTDIMKPLVAYKRNNEDSTDNESSTFENKYPGYTFIDIHLAKYTGELTEEGIEKNHDKLNKYTGAILGYGTHESGDFQSWVWNEIDISDGMHDVLEKKEEILSDFCCDEDETEKVKFDIYYTTSYNVWSPKKISQDEAYAFIGAALELYSGDEYQVYCGDDTNKFVARIQWDSPTEYLICDEECDSWVIDMEDELFEKYTKQKDLKVFKYPKTNSSND